MSHRSWIALAIVGGALAAFGALSIAVFALGPLGFDRSLVNGAGHLRTPWLNWVMVRVADLGAWFVLAPVTIAVVAALFPARRPRAAVLVAAAVTGAEILQVALKEVFARPRPELTPHLERIMSPSYPSGHATVSCAFALALCVVFWRASPGTARGVVVGIAAAYVLAVGFARVYLGVHYPSDVLSGWLLAIAWVAAVDLAVSALGPVAGRHEKARGVSPRRGEAAES